MSGPSKVIVLDPDPRAGRQLQLGFEREGVPTDVLPMPAEASRLHLNGHAPDLIVIGGQDERTLELIRRMRALTEAPILFAGRGLHRADVEAAGADEIVFQPAHLRDVVTIGRMLRGQPAHQRKHLVGNLAETTTVLTLIRALAALGRSAVLTLIRGLRRGEIRFFHGEVTSAQVAALHGQAALHQLLLWTDARFDYHHEDIVRRQQIPLSPDELFEDAERFLGMVRDASGALSPSMVLEQDVAKVHAAGKQIPTEVHGVLRMFDGHRVLADVLEDSPYRVFETLRVAQRAVEAGLLRETTTPRPKATWRAVLAIEEWLVGDTRDSVLDRQASDSGPMKAAADATGPRRKISKKQRKKRRAATPLPVAASRQVDIDWGALIPKIVDVDTRALAGVVPATHASGEIVLPSLREEPREKLEALMDTDKRERIFPRDIGLEPSVVWDDKPPEAPAAPAASAASATSEGADELAKRLRAKRDTSTEQARREADARAAAEMAARAEAEAQAAAAARAAAEAREAEAKAKADAEAKAKAEADEWARIEAEAKAKADAEERARAEAEAKAKAEAAERARADAEAKAQADAERARADAEAKAQADAERARADAEAKAQADAAERARAEAEAKAQADAAERARAEAEAKARADAAVLAMTAQAIDPARLAEAKAAADRAEAEVRAQLARESDGAIAAAAKGGDSKKNRAAKREAKRREADEARAIAQARAEAEARVLGDTGPRTRVAPDEAASDLVRALVDDATGRPPTEPTPSVVVSPSLVADAAPTATVDEPSDGVIREDHPITPRPLTPRPPAPDTPPDDRPDDAKGEITAPTGPTPKVELAEPTILVADLAAAHSAVSAIAAAQAAAPQTPNASTSSQELEVNAVRQDVQAFSDLEEEFFRAGQEQTAAPPVVRSESFDDLDEGYQHVGFWDRLLGRKKPKKR